jgi:hypothetical protein
MVKQKIIIVPAFSSAFYLIAVIKNTGARPGRFCEKIDHKYARPLRSITFFCMENSKDGDDISGYIGHIDFSENLYTEIFTNQN